MSDCEMIQAFQRGRAVRYQGRACKIVSIDLREQPNTEALVFLLLAFGDTMELQEATACECTSLQETLRARAA